MAAGLNAGTAYISIRPDLRGFHTSIQKQLGRVEKQFATAVSKGIKQGVRSGVEAALPPMQKRVAAAVSKGVRDGAKDGFKRAAATGPAQLETALRRGVSKGVRDGASDGVKRAAASGAAVMERGLNKAVSKGVGSGVRDGLAAAGGAAALGAMVQKSVGSGVKSGVKSGLGAAGGNAAQQGAQTGATFGSAFDRTVKAAVRAAAASIPKIKIDADSSPADREMAALRARLVKLGSAKLPVGVDAQGVVDELALIQARLRVLAANSPDLRVKVDSAAAVAKLKQVDRAADNVNRRKIAPRTDKGFLAFLDRSSLSLGAMLALAGTLGTSAIPIFGALAGGALALASGLGAAGAAFGAFGIVAAAALSRVIEGNEELKQLDEQRLGLVNSLKSAQAGLADAQRGVGRAQQDAADAIADAQRGLADAKRAVGDAERDAAQANADAQRDLAEARRGVADAEREAAQAVADAQRGVADARRTLADAQRALGEAHRDAAQAIAAAEQQVEDAQRGVIDAQQTLADAEVALTDARRNAADVAVQSAADIADAERQLVEAQQEVTDSLAGLHAAREQAKQDLDDLAEKTRDNALTVEGAEISLLEAEQRLATLESDHTATALELRAARLAVAEAEDRLSDSRNEATNDQVALGRAERAGIEGSEAVRTARERVADAERGVADAQLAVAQARKNATRQRVAAARQIAQAERGVADAQRGVADAQRAVVEAQRGVVEARRNGARQIADAQRAVADAERGVAQAQRAVVRARVNGARAIAEAQRGVGDAERNLAETRRNGAREVADAQRGVGDAERTLARARRDGAQAVADAQRQVAAARRGLAAAQKALARHEKERADALAKMGPGSAIALAGINRLKKAWKAFLGEVQPVVFRNLVKGMDALKPLMNALIPLVKVGAKLFGQFAERAAKGFRSKEFGKFIGWMSRLAKAVGPNLIDIVFNVAKAFGNVMRAFGPLARKMIKGFAGMTAGWAKSTNKLGQSPGFRKFTAWVREVGPEVMDFFGNLKDALVQLAVALAPVGRFMMNMLSGLFKIIAKTPLPVLRTVIVALVGAFIAWKAAVGAANFVASVHRVKMLLLGDAEKRTRLGKLLHTAATKAWTAVTWAASKAAKGAAFGMKLLNAAFRANPIGVVVTVIMLIVGALVLAYKKFDWFRNLVDGIWDAIVKGAKRVWNFLFGNSIIPDMVAGFKKAFGVIAKVFKWLWENVVPKIIKVVKGYFKVWWAVVKGIFMAWKWLFTDVLFPVLRWLWSKVVKPVFKAVWEGIKAAWKIVKGIFAAWKDFFTDVLFPVLRWLWSKVIKPVFKLVWEGIKGAWKLIKGIFDAWRDFFRDVLFPVLRFLWNKVVKPVFGWIGDKIKSVWKNGIKPVFLAIKDFIRDTLVPAFRRGIDKIGSIWDSLKRLAAVPVNFVIDTIYNKGIRKFVNKVLDFFDPGENNGPRLPKVSKVSWGGGSKSSGTGNTGNPANPTILAKGGVLPGYTPGRDIHHFTSPTGGKLHLSGGEAVMRPEWTRAVGGPRAVAAMNREAQGLHGPLPRRTRFARGGLWHTPGTRTQHSKADYPNAIWSGDINVPGSGDRGNPVRAWKAGTVSQAAMNGNDGSYGNVIQINHPKDNVETLYAHLSGIAVRAGQEVRRGQRIGRVGDTGNSSGPHLHFEIQGGQGGIDLGGILAGAARAGVFGVAGMLFNQLPSWVKALPGKIGDLIGKVTDFGKGAGQWVRSAVGGAAEMVIDKAKAFALDQFPSASAGVTQAGDYGSSAAGIWRSLMSTGFYSKKQAAGVMGNMVTESGLNPHIVQGGGSKPLPIGVSSGWGLVQWTPGTKVLPYLNGDGSVASQVSALTAQLRGKGSSPEGAAGAKLRATNSVAGATYAFGKYYERPADLGSTIAQRQADAERLYEAFRAQPPPGKVGRWSDRFRNRVTNADRRRAAGGVLPTLSDTGGWLQAGGVTINRTDKPEPVFTDKQWRILKRAITALTLNQGKPITEDWLAGMIDPVTKTATQLRNEFIKARDAMRGFRERTIAARAALREITSTPRYRKAARRLGDAQAAFAETRPRKEIRLDIRDARGDIARARRQASRTPMGRDALADYRKASRKIAKSRSLDVIAAAEERTGWRAAQARQRLRAAPKDSRAAKEAKEDLARLGRRQERLKEERNTVEGLIEMRAAAARQSPAVEELDAAKSRLETLKAEIVARRKAGKELRKAQNVPIIKRAEKAEERYNKALERQAEARSKANKAAAAYRAAQQKAIEQARSIRDIGLGLGTIEAAEFKSSQGILWNLRRALRTVKTWGKLVRELMGAGLRGPILQEFINAGPSAEAVRTAKSLLAGGDIAEINALQDKLRKASVAAGAAGAAMPGQPRAPRQPRNTRPIAPVYSRQAERAQAIIQYTGMPADTVETIVHKTAARVRYELDRKAAV